MVPDRSGRRPAWESDWKRITSRADQRNCRHVRIVRQCCEGFLTAESLCWRQGLCRFATESFSVLPVRRRKQRTKNTLKGVCKRRLPDARLQTVIPLFTVLVRGETAEGVDWKVVRQSSDQTRTSSSCPHAPRCDSGTRMGRGMSGTS